MTYNHPIYSVTADDWRLAGELEIGEEVLTKEGAVAVTKKVPQPGVFPVWNLEVRGWHNFLVGKAGIVVHNSYWGGTFFYRNRGIEKAIDHIWSLHSYVKRVPEKSFFDSSFSTKGKMKQLIEDAIARGAKVDRGNGTFVVKVEMPFTIGKTYSRETRTYRPTKWMTVILEGIRVRSSFPGEI